jgi:hypothetical protein
VLSRKGVHLAAQICSGSRTYVETIGEGQTPLIRFRNAEVISRSFLLFLTQANVC